MSGSNTPGPTSPGPESPAPDPVSAPLPTDEHVGESTTESLTEVPDSPYAPTPPAQDYNSFTGLPDAGYIDPFIGRNVDPYTSISTDTTNNPFVVDRPIGGTPEKYLVSPDKVDSNPDLAAMAKLYSAQAPYDPSTDPKVSTLTMTPEQLAQAVAEGVAAPDAYVTPSIPSAAPPAAQMQASVPPVEQPSAALPPVSPFNYSLYVGPGIVWHQYEGAIRDALDPNNPVWARVTLGVLATVMSPLALAEEYIGRPIANVPFDLQNYGSHIGEYGARSVMNFERGETAEGFADALDATASASLGFVSAAGAVVPVSGALENRARPTLPVTRPTLPGLVEAETAHPRSSVPVQQLGPVGVTTSKSTFRRLLTQILRDEAHPLHRLLDQQGNLTTSTARGMNELTWFENPNIVEAGHYSSAKGLAGAPDRLVMMSAYENRLLSAVLEHPSKGGTMLESGVVLSIGADGLSHVPVDFRTAEALVEAGFLDADIFANAPVIVY